MVASSQGGVDIETVAHESPEAIITVPVDIKTGPTQKQTTDLAREMGFTEPCVPQAAECFSNLYKLFIESDCSQVEINPMAESNNGEGRQTILSEAYDSDVS